MGIFLSAISLSRNLFVLHYVKLQHLCNILYALVFLPLPLTPTNIFCFHISVGEKSQTIVVIEDPCLLGNNTVFLG